MSVSYLRVFHAVIRLRHDTEAILGTKAKLMSNQCGEHCSQWTSLARSSGFLIVFFSVSATVCKDMVIITVPKI